MSKLRLHTSHIEFRCSRPFLPTWMNRTLVLLGFGFPLGGGGSGRRLRLRSFLRFLWEASLSQLTWAVGCRMWGKVLLRTLLSFDFPLQSCWVRGLGFGNQIAIAQRGDLEFGRSDVREIFRREFSKQPSATVTLGRSFQKGSCLKDQARGY